MLLSGFMFPFRAMPAWAQALGECFPITHFLRIVREITLKGAGLADIGGDLVRLSIILIVVGAFALARFRRTLE
jgi:ABC-2 type transport system permease protein